MTLVLGLDGCRAGWCGVMIDARNGGPVAGPPAVFPTFAHALATAAAVIAVDIPIGLLDVPGGRGCDREARRLLGPPRDSSVFSAPSRQACAIRGYPVACDVNLQLTGRRLTKQSHNIASKIREVDEQMKPALQSRVHEAHPELCFWALNLGSLAQPKKRLAGRLERWRLLRRVLPSLPEQPPALREMPKGCAVDDYIDALGVAWAALSIAGGSARRVPEHPATDERGLCMEIWFPACESNANWQLTTNS